MKQNQTYKLKKKRVAAILAIFIGLIITSFTSESDSNIDELQESIAEKIIRFHVLANSDDVKDQELKLMVKENVVEYITPFLENSQSTEESREILISLTDEIIKIAEKTIETEGYDYSVTAGLKDTYFPTKAYGDIVLPPGMYEAYEIEIGESKGANWWCILYPPLCFVDVTYGVVPDSSKEMLQNILDEDEYEVVSNAKSPQYEYKWKILEFFGIE